MEKQLGLRELCSKSSSLCYSKFPQKLYHYMLIIISKSTDYSQLYCHTFTAFLHFCNQNVQQYFILYKCIITIAVIVAKCLVTSVWGYEFLPADRSIRVSDCSIRVSRSGNSFYANYAWNCIKIQE